MSANKSGLTIPAAYAAPGKPFYLGQPFTSLTEPTLVAPITLQAANADGTLLEPAHIYVAGENNVDAAYVGAVIIQPGGNDASAVPGNGITVRTGAGPSTIVEIGTDAEDNNLLYIAGADGVGQVYDEKYNPAVALRDVVLSNVSPTNVVVTANPGEIFRCTQAGVLASATAAIGANVVVPRSGFYQVAIEVKMANAAAPAPVDVQLAVGVAPGGFNIGSTLTFAMTTGVVVNPYAVMDVNTLEFACDQVAIVNDGPVRQYSFMQLLEAGTTYTFTLKSSNALINIGSAGQIKAELIAMC